MNRSQLLEIIADQHEIVPKKNIIGRYERFRDIDSPSLITIISGVRRSGKSTLLNEIRSALINKDYYLNFDDDRLIEFQHSDFQLLLELFIEKFGEQHTFYFDEIQNIDGWERHVRRLHDMGKKIYITGSNAHMLSRELGTHLTGRYIQFELYPFSFKEFIDLKDPDIALLDIHSTVGKARYTRLFTMFTEEGGIPEFVINGNKEYLKTLYEGILYRDILTRHNLFKEKEIKELIYFIAGNVAKEVTQNSLAKFSGIKNATTIKDYLSYFEDSYLTFTVLRYDESIKRQLLSPRKVYFIDTALAKNISFRHSEDAGRILENIVFLELKRRHGQIFYYKGKQECDFIHITNSYIEAIQVSYHWQQTSTLAREINGLSEAMDYFNLKTGYILTFSNEDEVHHGDKKIVILPTWKWLVSK